MSGFRGLLALVGLWFLAVALCGCAGLPVGKNTYLFAGVGIVRVDQQGRNVGLRARMIGVEAGCAGITAGVVSLYCAHMPDRTVAVLAPDAGHHVHFAFKTTKEFQDEVFATARDR